MNRLSYLFLPLTAIGVSACSSNKAKEEVKRPNIIFMMTDDHTTRLCHATVDASCKLPIWIGLPMKVFVWTIAMRSMLYPVRQELVS